MLAPTCRISKSRKNWRVGAALARLPADFESPPRIRFNKVSASHRRWRDGPISPSGRVITLYLENERHLC